MAAKYSLDFSPNLNPCKNKSCKACGLYLHQAPVYDERKIAEVFWVGLSAIQFDQDEEKRPLSILTPSGALIHSIEKPYKKELSFYKTNIVKCVPLKADKIRYPIEEEMERCFPNFKNELNELNPTTVFLLGKQVSKFVFKKLEKPTPNFGENFEYGTTTINGINFVPIHHPSYILVYKRKCLDNYIKNIQGLFPLREYCA